MDFRSIALLALWTLISGPIFGMPSGPASASHKHAASQPVKHVKPLARR